VKPCLIRRIGTSVQYGINEEHDTLKIKV